MKPIDLYATSTDFTFDASTRVATAAVVEDPSLESFDIALAELQRRADTKTTVLEESLLRAESAQRRFWGINE